MDRHGHILVAPDMRKMVMPDTVPGLSVYARMNGMVCVPWNEDSCRLAYNCGLTEALEASPFMKAEHPLVEGKYPPLKHQALTSAFMTLFPRCYVLSEPRMGKTGSVILACDYMQKRGLVVGAVCIITTYTTMRSVWERALEETLPGAEVVVVHGTGRKAALQATPAFFVTNYDSVRLDELAFIEAATDGRIGMIVVDELTHVGNSEAKRSKAITRLCRHPRVTRVCGITGSPADNPDAVFGMGKCVNAGALPVTTKTGWERMIYTWWGPEAWKKNLKPEAADIIHKALVPAIRYRKADVLDLPPVTEQVRDAELTKEQVELMKKLETEAVAMLESGEQVTAANGGVLLQRCLQIALGTLKLESGEVLELPHEPRLRVMLDAMRETPNKTVVFAPYVAGCHMLTEEFRKAGFTAECITGAVNGTKRTAILRAFQEAKDPHVLVCHPITVGFGTELSAADTMIFAVPLLLGGFVYNQALERLSSVKQKASTINIIHVVSSHAERQVLTHLREGHSTGRTIAAMFENNAAALRV